MLIFAFIFLAFGITATKTLLRSTSVKLRSMFSSRNFMVCGFTFRPLSHLEFIVYGVRKCSDCILLHVAVWCGSPVWFNFSRNYQSLPSRGSPIDA